MLEGRPATREELALADALYAWYTQCTRRYPPAKRRARDHMTRDYDLIRWMYAS